MTIKKWLPLVAVLALATAAAPYREPTIHPAVVRVPDAQVGSNGDIHIGGLTLADRGRSRDEDQPGWEMP